MNVETRELWPDRNRSVQMELGPESKEHQRGLHGTRNCLTNSCGVEGCFVRLQETGTQENL
jgi:hypothetical protein